MNFDVVVQTSDGREASVSLRSSGPVHLRGYYITMDNINNSIFSLLTKKPLVVGPYLSFEDVLTEASTISLSEWPK